MRVAALIKQIPSFDELVLGPDGNLIRDGVELEMNPYCRRAVSQGVSLAGPDGECVVFTMGPPSAEDTLREAIAWGATRGVHLCDPAFAGSDTLATSRALAGAVAAEGPFDVILLGRNSVDGETGQVGPLVAELLGLPLLTSVRELEIGSDGRSMTVMCETDDGWYRARASLPVVVTAAERLCEPTKVEPAGRAAVEAALIRRVSADEVGAGPWGLAGSPTSVGELRSDERVRARRLLTGTLSEQVDDLIQVLDDHDMTASLRGADRGVVAPATASRTRRIVVVLERGRPLNARELLAKAAELAGQHDAVVTAFGFPVADAQELASWGADEVIELSGSDQDQDVARALAEWVRSQGAWVVLISGTLGGREIAGRLSGRLGIGLTGDATDVTIEDGAVVGWKPAFSGRLMAAIRSSSPIQAITIRPGVIAVPAPRSASMPSITQLDIDRQSSVERLETGSDDDVNALEQAQSVVAVGQGVAPTDFPLVRRLCAALGAEIGATRKVTDKAWLPRARQIGVTGRSIRPRLFVSLGSSGRFNHMVGVHGAHFVVAVNIDPAAAIFDQCDVGIVADWKTFVALLTERLEESRNSSQLKVANDAVR